MERVEEREGLVAVIGMAGRFPGADSVEAFWENLVSGADVRVEFTDEELAAVVPETVFRKEGYVRKGYVLENIDKFDAGFWGYSPREAEVIDPQQRLFLECAWEALEDAGYAAELGDRSVGVYASVTLSSYIKPDNLALPEEPIPFFDELIGNDKDYAASRVAYKLNLKGPAFSIQSACSSSLVAVAAACQALQDYHCDMALAGGASISLPQKAGYLSGQDGAMSKDGCCRAFDHRASGMMYGNGAGVVLLKRLEDALEHGDHIYGVVRGFAVNNDGSDKVGFTAPGVNGQIGALREALELAEADPGSVTFIETHGTGTPMGDPMEVRALEAVYGASAVPCALGSVKTNVGHLNSAAGIAGFIRALLSLEHRKLTPILHFERANPEIDFARSRFYVNTELKDWESEGPRRAAVSSFGLGGTNCHMILEEAPRREPRAESGRRQVIPLSARSEASLDGMAEKLAAFLEKHPETALADVAYTLQKGRRAFRSRRAVAADSTAQLVHALKNRLWTEKPAEPTAAAGKVYFMFPGVGSQHVGMGRGLYETETTFRQAVDRCAELLRDMLDEDIRGILFAEEADREEAERKLFSPRYTFAGMFAVEYALVEQWRSWGVRPAGCVGHGFGQYLAAVVGGVFGLEDALKLAVKRGELMDRVEEGAMLLLYASEETVLPLLRDSLSLAAINAAKLCTVSGRPDDVKALAQELTGRRIHYRSVAAARAGHSVMMDPILPDFRAALAAMDLRKPSIPLLSNVTGTWMTDEEAVSPDSWTAHIRRPVRFDENLAAILRDKDAILLEVGPGRVLGTLAKRHAALDGQGIVFSMRDADQDIEDGQALADAYAALFAQGADFDWYAEEPPAGRRIALPGYAFDRRSHWSAKADMWSRPAGGAAGKSGALAAMMGKLMAKQQDIARWFVLPQWQESFLPQGLGFADDEKKSVLFLGDAGGVAGTLAARLAEGGHRTVIARAGGAFAWDGEEGCRLRPDEEEDYKLLFQGLAERGFAPDLVFHAWTFGATEQEDSLEPDPRGYRSAVALARALAAAGPEGRPVGVAFLSSGLQRVTGREKLAPSLAPVLGPCRVMPNEYLDIQTRNIDFDPAEAAAGLSAPVAEAVLHDAAELLDVLAGRRDAGGFARTVAYRGGRRFALRFAHTPVEAGDRQPRLRERGVYMITGGFGGVAYELARYLVRGWRARLVLLGRTALPPREEWDAWLRNHPEDDPASARIRKTRELEALGGECLALAADVADVERMRAVRDEALARFGAIDGVFHAASTVSSSMIQVQTDERAMAVIDAKMRGTLVLEKILEQCSPDFLMLFSSLCSVTAPLGFTDYSAACCFLDAHALAMDGVLPYRVVSVNWGFWEGIGIGTVLLPKMMETVGEEVEARGILAEEGMECIRRILCLDAPQVMISSSNYPALVEELGKNAKNVLKNYAAAQTRTKVAKRPQLAVPYRAPQTATERVVAAVWQEILGIDAIGADDPYAELGGDSLHAIPMVSRLEGIFHAKVPIRSLVTENTVAKLAAYLAQTEKKPGQTEKIARLFIKIKSMSAEEVKAMLAKKG